MRFKVLCQVTFFPGGMHTGAPEMFTRLEGAVTFDFGHEFDLEDGRDIVTIMYRGKKYELPRSLFFSAYGSRHFHGLGPMVWT